MAPCTAIRDVLILGGGWTSKFLEPLLSDSQITFSVTTRDGRDSTIPFNYDPVKGQDQCLVLPNALVVLITFPVEDSAKLVKFYQTTHPRVQDTVCFILLGSTALWKAREEGGPADWASEETPWDRENKRGRAEQALLDLLPTRSYVLNLAGLWGGERLPKRWLPKVIKTQEELRAKGSLHLIHGQDVARALLYCIRQALIKLGTSNTLLSQDRAERSLAGRRWILTDLHVYDWWELAWMWGKEVQESAGTSTLQYEEWVAAAMALEGVRALPRDTDRFARRIDGRAFWTAVHSMPSLRLS